MVNLKALHLFWRESAYKDATYRSYSLARAYREDGKNKRKIVVKLGKLSPQDVLLWKSLLAAARDDASHLTSLEKVVVVDQKSFLDVAVCSEIWNQWGFSAAFPSIGKRKVDIADVARILTINRCIDPAAKSCVPEWFSHTVLPSLLAVPEEHFNPSRIFRELELIEASKEQLSSLIYGKLRRERGESLKLIFYDLSTSLFHGDKCKLVKWGKAKEGFDYHVVLALAVNKEGIPFHWDVLPGGTSDIKTIDLLLSELKKRFISLDTTLVFDRGFVSDLNLSNIEKRKLKYISGLDKPQIEKYADIDFSVLTWLDPNDVVYHQLRRGIMSTFDKITTFRDIGVVNERRYILGFNVEIYRNQRKAREKSVKEFREEVSAVNKTLKAARYDRDRSDTYKKFRRRLLKYKLEGFVEVELKETTSKYVDDFDQPVLARTYQADIIVNEKEMRETGKLDGYWMLVTNHTEKSIDKFDMSARDIIQAYRDKHVIESSFRDIKSFVEIAPVYVWNEVHVRAHYTICILSHIINRSLDLLLAKNKGSESADIVSHMQTLKELSHCMLTKLKIAETSLEIQTPTEINVVQSDLLKRMGVEGMLDKGFIAKQVKKRPA